MNGNCKTPHYFDDFISLRNQLIRWIQKWDQKQAYPFPKIKFDVMELSAALGTIGFSTETLESTYNDINDIPTIEVQQDMRIEITCGQSGIKTTLIKNLPECTCPSGIVIENSRYRNFQEYPFGEAVEDSVNDLLPYIPPERFVMIGNLFYVIFVYMNWYKFESTTTIGDSSSENCSSSLSTASYSSEESNPAYSSTDNRTTSRKSRISSSESSSTTSKRASPLIQSLKRINKLVYKAIEMAKRPESTESSTENLHYVTASSLGSKEVSRSIKTERPFKIVSSRIITFRKYRLLSLLTLRPIRLIKRSYRLRATSTPSESSPRYFI